jgi:hypothetical protein
VKAQAGVAAAIIGLTLLGFFQFPGHTYLQQDTQIYIPILEHLWDGSVLGQDLLVQRPHVAFTLYDELALGLRWATGAGFQAILETLQLFTRGLGLWGIYLISLAVLGDRCCSLLVCGVFGLGAAIDGPAVLTIEYEPSPRAFAIPLVFLAIGLMVWRKPVWAGGVAAAGFVLHPPSVLAFWAVYFCVERRVRAWAPFSIALTLLLLGASTQPGVKESQPFFLRIGSELEHLQRMRASYNWVSMWWRSDWWEYALGTFVIAAGYWRVRKWGSFLLGLPAVGLLSVAVSYLLLEKLKWGLIPQVQPARTLLFVTAIAVLLAAICGCLALRQERWLESGVWFFASILPPLVWSHWGLAALLGLLLVMAARFRWVSAPLLIGCYFVIPLIGHVENYPAVRTPELATLSEWAAKFTPKDSIFVFPEAGKKADAGVFRSEALRAIYVDWKGGGQVNYLPELGVEWWQRWQDVMLKPVDPGHYRTLGIGYIVLPSGQKMAGEKPVFQNTRYLVYSTSAKSP